MDEPARTAPLRFDDDCFRQAAALITAFAHNDLGSCEDLLDDDPRGVAAALTVMVYSTLLRSSDLTGRPFGDELLDLALAAAVAAGEGS